MNRIRKATPGVTTPAVYPAWEALTTTTKWYAEQNQEKKKRDFACCFPGSTSAVNLTWMHGIAHFWVMPASTPWLYCGLWWTQNSGGAVAISITNVGTGDMPLQAPLLFHMICFFYQNANYAHPVFCYQQQFARCTRNYTKCILTLIRLNLAANLQGQADKPISRRFFFPLEPEVERWNSPLRYCSERSIAGDGVDTWACWRCL